PEMNKGGWVGNVRRRWHRINKNRRAGKRIYKFIISPVAIRGATRYYTGKESGARQSPAC
ncbi:MAG: hypothetical protein R6U89_01240, partial [Dehalococcoidia bacterium]